MKIAENQYNIKMSGDFSTRSFGLEINAKAFDILVNKIYTDKIGAIVRELSANAYDSHIDAGKPEVPFEIHLPNTMEQYFYIRDYGTGISEEKMYDVYTRVFKSDKTGSNDFVGCMGLGSKTPFCYTDQFSIISYFNGIQYCYLAHKDARGIPSISASNNNGTPTNEPNGLKVMFNVNKYPDYVAFKVKVEEFLRYYKVKPRIIGQEIKFKLDSILYEDNQFRVLSFDSGANSSKVLMGNIPYNISYGCHLANIIFKVGIGQVEIEASREAIEDVSHNRNLITSLVQKIESCIKSLYEEVVKDVKNRLTCSWYTKYYLSKFSQIFDNKFSSGINNYYQFPSFCQHNVTSNHRWKTRKWTIYPEKIIDINNIKEGGKFIFVKHTKDVLIKKRQFEWLSENFPSSEVISFLDDKEQEVIKYFEILPEHIHDVNNIPLNPITPRVKSQSKTIVGWKRFVGHSTYDNHCWINDTKFDSTKDVLCCRKGDKVFLNEVEYSPVEISNFLKAINNTDIIYGLNAAEYKKYKISNTFIDFETWIKNKIINYINTNKDYYNNVLTYESLDYDDRSIYSFILGARDWIPKSIKEEINASLFTYIDSSYKNEFKHQKLYKFAQKLDKNFEIPLNNQILDGIKKYKEKYKLIQLVEHEPDFREEFFKLILGAKNVAGN